MTCVDDRRMAWALLSCAAAGPSVLLADLVTEIGVINAATRVATGQIPVGGQSQVTAADFESAARAVGEVERLGGRLVTPDDEEWPREALACLPSGSDNPGDVRPLALWVRGNGSLHPLTASAVGVVGARASTEYGNWVATEIAGDLAEGGWTVVSGAALGIDARAHHGAMAAGGPTIAVMPCGLDRPYPNQHADLLDQIPEQGLVVSEYPPGVRVTRSKSLDRNRLIAAFSAGVVAVEAGLRSGTASTLRWAGRCGGLTFAVPGPVTSEASKGCHRFIAEGDARLVTSAYDIIEALGGVAAPELSCLRGVAAEVAEASR
ncbi:DNA-processing protein DprA [Nocardia sp. NPDC050712]|uniref:DNA-processing protein DprA n=1 Tax=Nocardia sp. NPDC050712 TaxID=3155518 RepID=UPI00340D3231